MEPRISQNLLVHRGLALFLLLRNAVRAWADAIGPFMGVGPRLCESFGSQFSRAAGPAPNFATAGRSHLLLFFSSRPVACARSNVGVIFPSLHARAALTTQLLCPPCRNPSPASHTCSPFPPPGLRPNKPFDSVIFSVP